MTKTLQSSTLWQGRRTTITDIEVYPNTDRSRDLKKRHYSATVHMEGLIKPVGVTHHRFDKNLATRWLDAHLSEIVEDYQKRVLGSKWEGRFSSALLERDDGSYRWSINFSLEYDKPSDIPTELPDEIAKEILDQMDNLAENPKFHVPLEGDKYFKVLDQAVISCARLFNKAAQQEGGMVTIIQPSGRDYLKLLIMHIPSMSLFDVLIYINDYSGDKFKSKIQDKLRINSSVPLKLIELIDQACSETEKRLNAVLVQLEKAGLSKQECRSIWMDIVERGTLAQRGKMATQVAARVKNASSDSWQPNEIIDALEISRRDQDLDVQIFAECMSQSSRGVKTCDIQVNIPDISAKEYLQTLKLVELLRLADNLNLDVVYKASVERIVDAVEKPLKKYYYILTGRDDLLPTLDPVDEFFANLGGTRAYPDVSRYLDQSFHMSQEPKQKEFLENLFRMNKKLKGMDLSKAQDIPYILKQVGDDVYVAEFERALRIALIRNLQQAYIEWNREFLDDFWAIDEGRILKMVRKASRLLDIPEPTLRMTKTREGVKALVQVNSSIIVQNTAFQDLKHR